MALPPTRACPTCGTPMTVGQRFCSNCGSVVEAGANKPTELTPGGGFAVPIPRLEPSIPPPPPQNAYTHYPQLSEQPQTFQPPPPTGYQPTPVYARPQKNSSGRVLGQIGCGVGIVILLILALCGGAGYFAYTALSHAVNTVPTTTGGNTSVGSTNTGDSTATSTSGSVSTTPINTKITYAGVVITVINVQQSDKFPDDADPAQPGVARLTINEQNASTKSASYYYDDVFRLLLPDGTSIAPIREQDIVGPDASVSRKNWIDFPVPTSTKINQLTLRLGKSTEAQMDMPLTGSANLDKYNPKQANLNEQGQYGGVNWTLVSATSQWSADEQQAPNGMIYIVVALKIDNNTSSNFSGYPGDYLRLKSGDTTSVPSSYTVPLGVDAGQTNVQATSTFLMPQGATDFTFILLANAVTGATQPLSVPFQIH